MKASNVLSIGLGVEHLATVATPDYIQVIEIGLQKDPQERQALTGVSYDLCSATLDQIASLTVLMHLIIDKYCYDYESLNDCRLVDMSLQDPPAQ